MSKSVNIDSGSTFAVPSDQTTTRRFAAAAMMLGASSTPVVVPAAAAGTADVSAEPLVDQMAQDDLADALGVEEFAELLGRYLDSVPAAIDKVAAAVAQGEAPAIASAAHAVKGAAANMGFVRLSAEAARLEKAAKAGETAVDGLLPAVRAAAAATLAVTGHGSGSVG